MQEFPVTRATTLKPKPDPKTLVFGRSFTDHMLLMDYAEGKGWHNGRIVPYGPLALDEGLPHPRRRGAALPAL